ncbi:MAG: hypothetical protein NUV57_04700, partial [archaeon]|nr:hypothetical protein [archaeon]
MTAPAMSSPSKDSNAYETRSIRGGLIHLDSILQNIRWESSKPVNFDSFSMLLKEVNGLSAPTFLGFSYSLYKTFSKKKIQSINRSFLHYFAKKNGLSLYESGRLNEIPESTLRLWGSSTFPHL